LLAVELELIWWRYSAPPLRNICTTVYAWYLSVGYPSVSRETCKKLLNLVELVWLSCRQISSLSNGIFRGTV